jgi:hypothetical protein
MRIIDRTPLQDEKGSIGLVERIRGTLKYGWNWHAEMEAQKAVIAQLDRMLEKGFVLIRNFTLPNSEIVIPITLIGAGGIWVIHVTNAKGYFEAKGDQWNTVVKGKSQPARVNLLTRVARLSRAFEKYLEIQKFRLPVTVEPVLIASDPGAQIEATRTVARVVRSDAIKQFAGTLLQAQPLMSTGMIYDLADQIIDPNLRKEIQAPAPTPEGAEKPASRARAIFDAAERAKEFDPQELGFAFEDGGAPPDSESAAQQEAEASASPANRRLLGMSGVQVALLAVMLIVECCILLGGFGIVYYLSQ